MLGACISLDASIDVHRNKECERMEKEKCKVCKLLLPRGVLHKPLCASNILRFILRYQAKTIADQSPVMSGSWPRMRSVRHVFDRPDIGDCADLQAGIEAQETKPAEKLPNHLQPWC